MCRSHIVNVPKNCGYSRGSIVAQPELRLTGGRSGVGRTRNQSLLTSAATRLETDQLEGDPDRLGAVMIGNRASIDAGLDGWFVAVDGIGD